MTDEPEDDDREQSFLTDDEVKAIQELPRETPYLIQDVSRSMFSIARFYGAATYNGSHYSYVPPTDELVRDDVVKFVMKLREKSKRAKEKKARLKK